MKWRECSEWNRNTWHTGPETYYYTARKAGKVYTVSANWDNYFSREGPYSWWSVDGKGTNTRHETKEAAIAWCEADATKARQGVASC